MGGGIAAAWKLNEWTQHNSVLEKEKKKNKGRNVVCVCGRSDRGGDDTARGDEEQTDKRSTSRARGLGSPLRDWLELLFGPGTVEPYRSSRTRLQQVWEGEIGEAGVCVCVCVSLCKKAI